MDNYGRSKSPNPIWKIIWNNLIQIIIGIFLVFGLIYTWDSTDGSVEIVVLIITLFYLLIRVSVDYQSRKSEKEIEEIKE
ncbi:MAG: hypothetical protein ACW99A_05695 [Candidatus Kariarchaeaceae archaeon]|jgi:hypothetical protein